MRKEAERRENERRGTYLEIWEFLGLFVSDGCGWGYKPLGHGRVGFLHEAVVDAGRAEEVEQGGADGGARRVGAGDDLHHALGFALGLGEAVAHEGALGLSVWEQETGVLAS